MLDKNGESGQFCLVQDLVVMISVLHIENHVCSGFIHTWPLLG